MNITLEEIYFATGSIAFVLISVSIIASSIMLYRASKKIQETQEKTRKMIQDSLYTKYTFQAGVLRYILGFLGGDRENER